MPLGKPRGYTFTVANSLQKIVEENPQRKSITFQNLGPGLLGVSNEEFTSMQDVEQLIALGMIRNSGPSVHKGKWHGMTDTVGTRVIIREEV